MNNLTISDSVSISFSSSFTDNYFEELNSLPEWKQLKLKSNEYFYYDEWRKYVVWYLREFFPSLDPANIDSIFSESNCWSNFLNIVRFLSLTDLNNNEEPNIAKAKELFEFYINESRKLNVGVTEIENITYPSEPIDVVVWESKTFIRDLLSNFFDK